MDSSKKESLGITMDPLSFLHDIFMPAFTEYKLSLNLLYQQTLRPYSKFKKLIVAKIPKGYGNDSKSILDNQLREYIISPIDNEMIDCLKKAFQDCIQGDSFDTYSLTVNILELKNRMNLLEGELNNIAAHSAHLRKCIRFTVKNSVYWNNLQENYQDEDKENIVKELYLQLLTEMAEQFSFLLQFIVNDDENWKNSFPYPEQENEV